MSDTIKNYSFLSHSGDNDFTCRDIEIESASGVYISDGSISSVDQPASCKLDFTKNYSPLRLPVPQIYFALKRASLPGWNPHADTYPEREVTLLTPSADSAARAASEILTAFGADAEKSNLFTSPFLVMAVWRLNDGNYVSPSSPVLMIPQSSVPMVASDDEMTKTDITMKVVAGIGALQYRLTIPETIRNMSDRVGSLDIMVSKPLWNYKSPQMTLMRRVSSDAFCVCLKTDLSGSEERKVSSGTFQYGWKPVDNDSWKSLTSLIEFYSVSSLPVSELKNVAAFTDVAFNIGFNLAETYRQPGYVPSYSSLSFERSDGAVKFKDRILAWAPTLVCPGYNTADSTFAGAESGLNPRWVFHPDPSAKEYQYTDSGGVRRKLPLTQHPALYGSYYYGGLDPSAEAPAPAVVTSDRKKVSFLPDSIWISPHSAYDVFYDKGLQSLKAGSLIAVCRAYRSSGLVATVSPTLYVFSSEGVFLFRESAGGEFTDAGLIAGYVLKDADSLFILPTGITFMTIAGDTVSIEGTSVKILSSGSFGTAPATRISLLGSGSVIKIVTRPIKIDGGGEWKRLRKVFLRGNFESDKIGLTLFGSHDMRHWYKIASRKGSSLLSAMIPLNRFYRIEIDGVLEAGESLEGLTLAL